MNKLSEKPWSGRFAGSTEKLMEKFNASIGFDKRLYKMDIEGSRAQTRALARMGILTKQERERVLAGLNRVEREIDAGALPLTDDLEDIHMAVEKRLIELVGDAGAKIHTGRSRNDQVALDERLFLREAIADAIAQIERVMAVVLDVAESHLDVIMPGYTHVQQAQPIRFSHYAMACSGCWRATARALKTAGNAQMPCPWARARWPEARTRSTENFCARNWALTASRKTASTR